MKTQLRIILVAAALVLALGIPAKANTIGMLSLPSCNTSLPVPPTCPNATYNFNIGTTSATLTITINSGLSAGVNDLLGGVALGFLNSGSITLNPVTPGTGPGGASLWTFTTGTLSSNGCGSNSGAFVCTAIMSNPKTGGTQLVTGGTYSWTWNYTLAAGSTIFPVGGVTVKANYNPHLGLLVSQTGAVAPTTPVPEPGSLLLFGTGLIGVAGIFHRKLIR